jgi:sugar/nucleoside kinase (ribokinase family)
VRAPQLGPLVQDASFDPAVLDSVSVLKLSEEEAQIVAGGHFDAEVARSLGVAEILVTLGSHGEEVWVDGEVTHVPTTPVHGVETTGAGDAFMVAYVSARHDGATPVEAARAGSSLVVRMLSERKRSS